MYQTSGIVGLDCPVEEERTIYIISKKKGYRFRKIKRILKTLFRTFTEALGKVLRIDL